MLRRIRVLAPLLALFLLAAVARPVAAATAQPLELDEALTILQTYEIVRGDESGNLNLEANLTRAEAAAIFVRAMRMGALAGDMANQVPFADARGHWGAGEIALAHQLGLMRGDTDGRFRPNDPITYAEVLTVLLRMVGQEPTGAWSPALVLSRAQEVGIAPEGIEPSAYATRQNTFWSLAKSMTVPVSGGRNLLGRYFDQEPPLLRVEQPTPTSNEQITLKGSVTGAYQVLVNGRAVPVDPETGAFTAQVDLTLGRNAIRVEAVDRAENRATAVVEVERRPAIAKLVIEGPDYIPPESTRKLRVTAYDADGNEVELYDLKAELSVKEHTFDPDTLTLTTGARRGRAALTLTAGKAKAAYTFEVQGPSAEAAELQLEPINGGRAIAPEKEYTVTVKVVNESGRVATDDYGRKVELVVEDMSAVMVTPKVAETVKGVATFTLEASHEGTMNLKVKSSGLETLEQEVQVLGSPRIVLTTTAKQLAPDGQSKATIKATLMDDTGKAVNNPGRDIELEVRVRGIDGYIENPFLTIPSGKSTATVTATLVAGYQPGTARVWATVDSTPSYPVQSVLIPVDAPLAGARFELTAKPTNPEPGDEVTITLRVLDENGRVDTKASYAFLIRLSTSNRDRVVDGVPAGVDFRFKGTEYKPVYGGDSRDVYAVVGRTYKGSAEMVLKYDAVGVVRLTPVGVSRTNEAYHQLDGFGPAASTRGYGGETLEVRFANRPAYVALLAGTCDSISDVFTFKDGKIEGPKACEVYARPGRALRVEAVVVDIYGDPVPGFSEVVTIKRVPHDRVTSIEGSSTAKAEDGEAEFTVWVYNGVGYDQYQATAPGVTRSNTLTIYPDN